MAHLTAFLFGVAIATAVGPIALWIVNQGMNRGLAAGAACALGAAFADLVYALVAFGAGAGLAPLIERHREVAEIVASLALIGAGALVIRGAVAAGKGTTDAPAGRLAAGATAPPWRLLLLTWTLTILNPLTVIAFLGFATQLPLAGSPLRVITLALALFLGSLAIQLVFALGGATLRRLVSDPRVIRALNIASGSAIAAFGLVGLVRAIRA